MREQGSFFLLFIFSPLLAWCKLTELHRTLFEVLSEHKSLIIKAPCGESDLNKHSLKIKPSPGSSNVTSEWKRGAGRAGGGIRAGIPADGMGFTRRLQPFGGCSCPESITAA